MKIKELKSAVVAIVTIRHRCPMPRDITYQATLDPAQLSHSGEHIRVGNYVGDELRGWIPTADIEVREELKISPRKMSKPPRPKVQYAGGEPQGGEPQAIAA